MQQQEGECTQPTQPTQPTQTTQRPPQNTERRGPDVFATLVSHHPHLEQLEMKTSVLLGGGGYTIGRNDDCDVTIDRNFVSGKHCRLYMEEDPETNKQNLFIIDTSTYTTNMLFYRFCQIDSTNGTYVNDRILGRDNCTVLFHRDRLSFSHANDALPSDIALDYTVEFADIENRVSAQPEFDVELLRSYDFKREIGAGNFAKVWLAIHKPTGSACACKVINKKKHLFSSGLTKVFEREISIMKQLRHQNIVPLHKLHTDKDRIYIFMECLDGGDLFSYLSEHGAFTETACRPLFKQICSAVRYLHSNGVTHRDIKLDNILIKLTPTGLISSVKIADFGLARAVGDGDLMRTICGTPSYLAPEIICRSSTSTPYSKSVDIWALGVVLYALHINSFPFSKLLLAGDAATKSIESYARASRLTDSNTKYICLSEALRDLIKSMLQVDPENRISIDATTLHPWTQTGENGIAGLLYEPFEVWGKLVLVETEEQGSTRSRNAGFVPVDLFRDCTVIGRSSKSHIQLTNARISSTHCEIVFANHEVRIHNTSRGSILINGQALGSGQTSRLRKPFTFSLLPHRPNSAPSKDSQYTFQIELLDQPWKTVWMTNQSLPGNAGLKAISMLTRHTSGKTAQANSPPGTSAAYKHIAATLQSTYTEASLSPPLPPPPLILPVQSIQLSRLPFGSAKLLAARNGETKEPWAILSVLDDDFPSIHIYDQSISFGRHQDCIIRFDDSRISQQHCILELDNGQALVRNKSTNGTFVNSKLVDETAALSEGDELVLLFDRITTHASDHTWLGQRRVFDGHGFPGKPALL
ncbi:hypothetical protein GGI12_001190 [Dipsacomyces acuminosporus]|nr:hypothetical protein GGI12_001190 [Dipsacomyces acuminosporus]